MAKKKTRKGPPPVTPIPPKDLMKTRAYILDIIDLSDAITKKIDMLTKIFKNQNKSRDTDNYAQLVTKRVDSIRSHVSMIPKLGITALNWSKIKNLNGT